jgi:hypothetical protein
VCTWTREIYDPAGPAAEAGDVWIEAEDRIVDGRVMRSAPQIAMVDERKPMTSVEARRMAQALLEAASVIACAAFDENLR